MRSRLGGTGTLPVLRRWLAAAGAALGLIEPAEALAGMPTPVLSEWARERFMAISFFGVFVLLVSAGVVRGLWNWLARDFSRLPRLGYGKALAVVFLWGMLFAVVLTMIAGARELMTPGAWEKDGLLYKVAPGEPAKAEARQIHQRREALHRLKESLLEYAVAHGGRFPDSESVPGIAASIWEAPGSGMRYLYFPGLAPDDATRLVACEPAL